jgi:serine/threonine-protein phosphatase 5
MASAEDAVELKEKGNAAFKAHDWPTAIDFYTKAIAANGKEPSFYTNRAQVRVQARSRDIIVAHNFLLGEYKA